MYNGAMVTDGKQRDKRHLLGGKTVPPCMVLIRSYLSGARERVNARADYIKWLVKRSA